MQILTFPAPYLCSLLPFHFHSTLCDLILFPPLHSLHNFQMGTSPTTLAEQAKSHRRAEELVWPLALSLWALGTTYICCRPLRMKIEVPSHTHTQKKPHKEQDNSRLCQPNRHITDHRYQNLITVPVFEKLYIIIIILLLHPLSSRDLHYKPTMYLSLPQRFA